MPKSRVLLTSLNAEQDSPVFKALGFEPEVLSILGPMKEKALLLWSPKEGSVPAIWINQCLNLFPSEISQRFIATLFKAVPPGGWLGLFIREGEGAYTEGIIDARKIYLYSEKAICSLLEQTGFSVVQLGRNPQYPGMILILAKRI